MNFKASLLTGLCGLTFLTGCELALLPLVPIVMPMVYVGEQSGIVQPVAVVSSKGASLTPKFPDVPKGKFTANESTIVCRGIHVLQNSTREVSLVCNNDLKGKMVIEKFMTREIKISVGPRSSPGADNGRNGYLTEVTFRCSGNFNVREDQVDPFLISCNNGSKAVVSPIEGGRNPAEFKVWISKTP